MVGVAVLVCPRYFVDGEHGVRLHVHKVQFLIMYRTADDHRRLVFICGFDVVAILLPAVPSGICYISLFLYSPQRGALLLRQQVTYSPTSSGICRGMLMTTQPQNKPELRPNAKKCTNMNMQPSVLRWWHQQVPIHHIQFVVWIYEPYV